MLSLPRSAVTCHLVSAKRLVLPGSLVLLHRRSQLTLSDSNLVRLLSVSSESFTPSQSSTMASSFAFDLPIPKLRSSSSSRVKNVATGAAANTATPSNTPRRRHSQDFKVVLIIRAPTAATSLRLEPVTTSPLPRPSHLRKSCLPVNFCFSLPLIKPLVADIHFHRENAGNKAVPNARANAWPMQGGLQSITNSSTIRTQQVNGRGYTDVINKHTAVEVIPEINEPQVETETASPGKVNDHVEPATGKENISSHN